MEIVTWFVLTVLSFIGLRRLIIGLWEHDSPSYRRQRYEARMKKEDVWWEYQKEGRRLPSCTYVYFNTLKRYFVNAVKRADC